MIRDDAWHERLHRRFWRDVHRQVGAWLGGYNADAEDLTQQVFVEAWRRRERVPDEAWPWLYATARNLARNFERRQRTRRRVWSLLRAEPVSHDGGISGLEQRQDLVRAKRMVRADEWEMLRLFYSEGRSTAEIAGLFGSTPDAVRTRLSRAKKKLRRAMVDPAGRPDATPEDGDRE